MFQDRYPALYRQDLMATLPLDVTFRRDLISPRLAA
jgi:hypothetical protein